MNKLPPRTVYYDGYVLPVNLTTLDVQPLQERLQKRKEYFKTMDTNKGGTISFDEWLTYAYDHIVGKVAGL